tara:strand:- start:19905 stop:20570 length:666 start_codon:yes stop_codon:yes gene_type:complete
MSTEKKVLKKRGRKPKNNDKKQEDNNKDIQENLIIQLKKSYVDDYDISSYDKNKSQNENVETKQNSSKLCWNCCHAFHNHVYGIPMKYIHGIFYVYGSFCSLECGCRYAHDNLKDHNFDEIFSLINLYSNIMLDKKDKIEMAPNRLLLESFGGNLTIDEYRSKNVLNYEIRIPPILPINHIVNKYETNQKTNNKDFLKLYRKKPVQSDKKNITTSMNLIID